MELKLLGAIDLIIIYIYQFQIILAMRCDKHTKMGPYILKNTIPRSFDLHWITIETKMYYLSNPYTDLIIGSRQYWKASCYNGGPLDSNTRCPGIIIDYPPTESELIEFDIKKKCQTGPDIIDEVTILYESDNCAGRMAVNGVWHNETKTIERIQHNNHFANHMCNINWGCSYSKSKIPVDLYLERKELKMKIMRNDIEQEQIISEKGSNFFQNGQWSYLVTNVPIIKNTTRNLNCFWKPHSELHHNHEFVTKFKNIDENMLVTLSKDQIYCEDNETNYFFDIRHKEFCFRDACYEVIQNGIKIPANRHIRDQNSEEESVSKDTVEQIVMKLRYEAEGLRFTLAELDHRFGTLVKQFNEMAVSVAKIDEKLIGRLIHKNNIITEFVTDEAFFTKSCEVIDFTDSNCVGDYTLKDGRAIEATNKTKCIKVEKAKSLDLFHYHKIWWPSVGLTPVHEIISDLPAWQHVAETKQDVIESLTLGKKRTAVTSMYSHGEYFIQNHFTLIYSFIMILITALIAITICCLICRKK